MGDENIAFRVGLTVALIIGGFLFPPLFLLAALVGWALISDLTDKAEPEPDEWFTRRWTATAADPEWKSYYLPFCESPAETAFLEAIIEKYGLIPDKGVLRSSRLTLNLQVKIPPYRVDFLADDWLVIEIDGAAYHSSPEAIARDQERDQFLEQSGYSVLRIPAKVVLSTPTVAMNSVNAAKAVGRRPRASSPMKAKSPISLDVLASVTQAARSVDNFVTDLNDRVKAESAVQQAMGKSRQIFDREKIVIDGAYESAFRAIEFAATLRDKSDEFRKHYAESYQRLASLFEDKEPRVKMTIAPIVEPYAHPDPKINEAVQRAHDDLMVERIVYFEVVRDRLAANHRLAELVRLRLEDWGCLNCWANIAPHGLG